LKKKNKIQYTIGSDRSSKAQKKSCQN
jgi:hypothetical protein